VEIETPAGQITMGETRARDVGLPIYPGATATQSGGGIEFTSMENERVGLTEVHLVSGDPLEKVDAWYRERLGPDFQHEGPGTKPGSIHLRGAKVRDEDIAFVSDRDDLVRVVALKRRGAGVEIALVRIGGRETQEACAARTYPGNNKGARSAPQGLSGRSLHSRCVAASGVPRGWSGPNAVPLARFARAAFLDARGHCCWPCDR